MRRSIGSFEGSKRDTLVVVFGAMHGNEPAGIEAFQLFLKMLAVEPITNPNFSFKGKIIGLKGHTRAIKEGKRYINHDLNRLWKDENVERILASDNSVLDEEELEIKEIIHFLEHEINTYHPSKIIILDIHTTSAQGGIFTIPAEDEESLDIAKHLHAPVVLDLLKGLKGTSLHYFNTKNLGKPTAAVCFEAGQHDDPLSVNRTIAAIIFTLQAVNAINIADINPQHTAILENYAKNLPKVTTFFHRHSVNEGDEFEMMPGFTNFQMVKKGTLLAKDKNGDIYAEEDAFVLMPLYQKQGEDGFFLVK